MLSDTSARRARWYEATTKVRADAAGATGELRRRLPGIDLPAFHEHARDQAEAPQSPQISDRAAATAQPGHVSSELQRAARLAGQARARLSHRQAQAHRHADRERQRQADEPAISRWPHRDAVYDYSAMYRRRADLTAAQLAAQDHPSTAPDLTRARDWKEPGHHPAARPSCQAERNELEAGL